MPKIPAASTNIPKTQAIWPSLRRCDGFFRMNALNRIKSVAVKISKDVIGWISAMLSRDNEKPNSSAHISSIMQLKNILKESNGQM